MRRAFLLLSCGLALLAGPAEAGAQESARVDAALTPRTLLFGDALYVRVNVFADSDLVDVASVELESDFRPFEVERTRRELTRGSALSRARFTIALRCLSVHCLPPTGSSARSTRFSPLVVHLEDENGEQTLEAPLPPVRMASRLSVRESRGEDRWSYDVATLAPVSYPISPGLAIALLWALAVALGLLAALLVAYATTGKAPHRALAARRSPLQRALALVRRAAKRGADERREALERLARELRRAGHPELAERSGALAWSRPEPGEPEIGALVGDVERSARAAGP
ncbi:MAG: hypothetical protein GEU88_11000 [Solirubrobacterales bacterium]|nr:hypothetical protein [Solirubrobacterales bacterium]